MFESLGDLIAFGLLGLQPETAFGEALQFFVMAVTKIFVLLVVMKKIWVASISSLFDLHVNLSGQAGSPSAQCCCS